MYFWNYGKYSDNLKSGFKETFIQALLPLFRILITFLLFNINTQVKYLSLYRILIIFYLFFNMNTQVKYVIVVIISKMD